MSDARKAIDTILDFLSDDTKKLLLVKGYDDIAKLKVVLSCLNKKFDRGIIRTSSMQDISEFVNRAFNKKLLPNTIKSTTVYKLGKMTVNINSYVSATKFNPRGNESTFTVFFPVQTVLNDSKRFDALLTELESTNSRKVILITTNDPSIDKWDIENNVDQVYFYSVEEDNPQIMINLRSNGAI
ncbi:hypothetical protein HNR77_004238 [Paenibacillus sp. JGP012]|uniref:hypothetical protein n=1 Tax=Paenibacillus sp. JGP012 TaxID=2735914 RepID=UPI00160F841C|nr:hypothetical protein [Paenibacillus sp. JGP012]MBB6023138.1 hypothetical protein [Paenibacillus sp. JGP012]